MTIDKNKLCSVKQKGYFFAALALIAHMFYKVVIDSYTGGLFNIPFLLIICTAFVLYFTKEFTGQRSKYAMVSFALYALYIVFMTLTDDNFTYIKRGVYEYGFYQAILFGAAFMVTKVNKNKMVKAVVLIGLPFVVVGALEAVTVDSESAFFRSYTDNAMRTVGWARSPLSLGMLSGIYCMFAFAHIRISRNKWYLIPAMIGALSLLVSGSRGPMVAVIAAVISYLLLEAVITKGKKAIKPIAITAVVLVILAVLFFTSDLEFRNAEINAIYVRLKKIVDWKGDAGNVGRLETWSTWFKVFLDNFWTGIGMSRTGSWSTGTLGVTESGFLRHLVELGFIGSLFYYNLIVSCIVSAVRAAKKAQWKLDHYTLLNISIVVLVLVEDMVLQITEEITVAFFLWWCLGALLGNNTEKTATKSPLHTKTKKNTSISIVATTYNGEKFIVEQLESLRLQTRPADEVLIFDDCSTDHTANIVEDYILKNQLNHWTFKVNEKNKGWKENFKSGLLQAKGDLVFPCDQDDIWRKDKLEICEKIMQENPQILVLTSNYEKFGDCRQEIVPNCNDKQIVPVPFNGNLFKIFYPGCSYCIRQTFLKNIEKNWTSNSPHDATIWRYAIIRNGLYALNDSLLLWRVYNTSTYEVELAYNHNWEKKRQWLDYAIGVLKDMDRYLFRHKEYATKPVLRALKRNKDFLALRMEFYDHFSILAALRLIMYLKYYAAPIQYLGDWRHTIKKHQNP